MTAQSLISVLALVLLWILYPREENYGKAADLSLHFLYTEWSGIIVEPYPIPWRKTSGMHNVLDINITRVDPLTGGPLPEPPREVKLTGGFYTEGEVGPVKVTTHVAFTTAMLAWSVLEFPDWWGGRPRAARGRAEVGAAGARVRDRVLHPRGAAAGREPRRRGALCGGGPDGLRRARPRASRLRLRTILRRIRYGLCSALRCDLENCLGCLASRHGPRLPRSANAHRSLRWTAYCNAQQAGDAVQVGNVRVERTVWRRAGGHHEGRADDQVRRGGATRPPTSPARWSPAWSPARSRCTGTTASPTRTRPPTWRTPHRLFTSVMLSPQARPPRLSA